MYNSNYFVFQDTLNTQSEARRLSIKQEQTRNVSTENNDNLHSNTKAKGCNVKKEVFKEDCSPISTLDYCGHAVRGVMRSNRPTHMKAKNSLGNHKTLSGMSSCKFSSDSECRKSFLTMPELKKKRKSPTTVWDRTLRMSGCQSLEVSDSLSTGACKWNPSYVPNDNDKGSAVATYSGKVEQFSLADDQFCSIPNHTISGTQEPFKEKLVNNLLLQEKYQRQDLNEIQDNNAVMDIIAISNPENDVPQTRPECRVSDHYGFFIVTDIRH